MSAGLRHRASLMLLALVALLFLPQIAASQDNSMLLRLQHSRASVDINANTTQSVGRNVYDAAAQAPDQGVWKYPNNSSCLVVYNDGRYFLEKRDEQKVGKPKTKTAEGTLSAGDLQQLQAILADEDLKKIANPKAPELPSDTEAIRDAETLDVEIDRAGVTQRFSTVKERVKTGDITGNIHNLPSSGLDTFIDNGAPYKKTLSPLIKWFESVEKKSKSSLKDSKPQYCQPMNIG